MEISPSLKIAIVHDCLTVYGGAEKVLSQIFSIFPHSDLFSVIDFFPEDLRKHLANKRATTSFIQKLPWARRLYTYYLPLMPFAIEQLDIGSYDLIISSSYAVAKGIIPKPNQLHICYCHSPLRYAWDMRSNDFDSFNIKGLKKAVMQLLLYKFRAWDACSSNRVDYFVANSHYVARRIQQAYRRHAHVISPGIEVDRFAFVEKKEDFYLAASRFVPYKRLDLIIEAFSKMANKKLIVIGDGPEYHALSKKAGPNISLLGYQSSEVLRCYMQKAKAFVFAAREDFGIIPLEAQACGTPVIAYANGGCLETIKGFDSMKPTGVFFYEQTAQAIIDAVKFFEKNQQAIDPKECRENALHFSTDRFRSAFHNFVVEHLKNRND